MESRFLSRGLLAIIATAVAAADRLTPASAVGFFDTTYLGFAASWRALFFGEILTAREGFWIAMIAAGAFPLSAEWQNREEH